MHFRVVSALVALALAGLGIASCTQDFSQFEPQAEGPGGCLAGEKLCDETCVAIDDPSYGCGNGCDPCFFGNAAAACVGGSCAIDTCNAGFDDCDGMASNGCETETATDLNNCGACDTQCTAPNAAGQCQAGTCSVGQCNSGFANCDMDAANGCEAILSSDPNNCGACGTTCNAFQACLNGDCKDNPCGAGTANCNGDAADGCETLLGTTQNCAFCNNACNLANATEACVMGMCAVDSCDMGWADCDMTPGNGCEVNTTTVMNCGACGNACPSGPNSMATCANGMCGLACSQNFADCNNDPTDGCEVNLLTSTANCGTCGHLCSGANSVSTGCTNGACTPTCLDGFGDCTKPAAPMMDDGCETATVDDVFNCGACGRVCSGTNTASRSCTGTTCTSTCDLGFANCTMPMPGTNDDGCELNVQTNGFNCGGCGNDCSGSLVCNAGALMQKQCGCSNNPSCGSGGSCSANRCSCGGTQCGIGENCVGGTCSCNGGASCGASMLCCQNPAGCVDPYTDAANCGACGRACPSGFVCGGMPPQAPQCRCDEDADCNGGSTGTCNMNGTCQCGAMQCALGERCLSNGTCG
ncbi:MAG: hypothetical protein IPM54_22475 [Polyangiaceae bacterium]|nr:hypothetical protein [Polyangiaceae bacterium]